MLPTEGLVELSRWQFAFTTLYHFIFVPLTLGLAWILFIMESVYVMTGKEIYKDMTRFWGKLFGINFALGVTTGITLEFQFGTNWAYYSHYVGDIFGAPLAIEGLFSGINFCGAFFLRLGTSQQTSAFTGDISGGIGFQPFRAVDPDSQCLDAASGGSRIQFRNHAHGADQF
jgi:uncharacterized membrane protein